MYKPASVEFFRAIPAARMPVRADKSALGSIPTAAYKYCQPLTTATGYGWYVYSPINFALLWDGSDALWTYDGSDTWLPLDAAQFPDFLQVFNSVAPPSLKGHAPVFLADSPRRGIIQIWSGLFARTSPDWSLCVRPVVNYPAPKSYDAFEAIVETDAWFGPLFINIRLATRNRPIVFTADRPLFQVQPIHRSCYAESVYQTAVFRERPLDFGDQEWRAYQETMVAPNKSDHRLRGEYARRARKRGKSDPE